MEICPKNFINTCILLFTCIGILFPFSHVKIFHLTNLVMGSIFHIFKNVLIIDTCRNKGHTCFYTNKTSIKLSKCI